MSVDSNNNEFTDLSEIGLDWGYQGEYGTYLI